MHKRASLPRRLLLVRAGRLQRLRDKKEAHQNSTEATIQHKRILLSGAYLELLRLAVGDEIVDASDFGGFLIGLKDRLRGHGRHELFDAIVREEIHMFEAKDAFL